MIDIGQLEKRSQELLDSGNQILNSRGLKEILSGYGDLTIIGSFALNLLIKPDLDIYVKIPSYDLKKHFEIFANIAETLHPLRMKFIDLREVNWTDFPMKEGLFIGVSLIQDGIEWSIDGWALTPNIYEERVAYHQEVQRLLTPELRPVVWEIKSQIYKSPAYKSRDLYQAVLKEHVNSLSEFYNWYKAQYQKDFLNQSLLTTKSLSEHILDTV